MASRRDIVRRIASAIVPLYDEREAENIARRVVMERLAVDFPHLVADYDAECRIDDTDEIIAELRSGRPVQYLLGHTEFCGFDIKVCDGVLIPRPETEELVCRIADSVYAGAHILDVGTGSGAIALSLAQMVADARVEAVDISDTALAVARENALRNGADVVFHRADALGDMRTLGTFDLIVSNPPYVPSADRATMHPNVRDYEPEIALFVPDDNPLLFYDAIARNACDMLVEGGWLWFEIYEKYGDAICRMLSERGFRDVECMCDVAQKPRFVWCRK